jgi:hypothetical protein
MYSDRRNDMLGNQFDPAIRGGGRPALFSSGLSLQSDKARPHTARHYVKQIQDLQLEVDH